MHKRVAVIMAGGSGERFWPLSRVSRPKQLLRLTDPNRTLLEEAVQRIEPLVGADSVYVITGRHLEEPIRESGALKGESILAEPMKRNTLGALVWVAAQWIARGATDVTFAILTADHKIGDAGAFRETVSKAMETAELTGALVTCGVTPTRPETGYGYVELDRGQTVTTGAIKAVGFREKPDVQTAAEYVLSGRFLWNSGMFFYTLQTFMAELEHSHPAAFAITHRIAEALAAGDMGSAEAAFAELPNLSIDYALAEKAKQIFVVESGFAWDDVGAWDALSRSLGIEDEHGNVALGNALVIDSRNAIIYNDVDTIIAATVGVDDVVLVVTPDAVLLCKQSESQRVKEIVEALKAKGHKSL